MEASKERREAGGGGGQGNQQQQQQQPQREREQEQEQGVKLPTESSPYVKYKDLEDYKMQGYGTQGHEQPVDRPHHGGGTDAPTLSGSGLSECEVRATDAINRQGVP
ncbi:uncharacterized protein [Typha angustifolia]|uniref:uncharacterized protein n=1 Tax=Typha angustifolia TaxID=59011 RepID=UPI003C2DBAD8